jgi:DnaJ like chaperone protein
LYWGKIIGTLAGFATKQPLLGVVGLLLGHQFDRGYESWFDPHTEKKAGGLGDDYVRPLFRAMGHLAKADGQVTEDEIRAARNVMHRLGLAPAQASRAIAWFDEGKQPNFGLRPEIRKLRNGPGRRSEFRSAFVRMLLEVSLAKGRVRSAERAALWTICRELDISRVELAQLEAIVRAQKGFRQSPAGDADSARVRAAYATLGVDSSASNEEIKKAYRRMMNRNHPDKLAGSEAGGDALTAAAARTREIRRAWELLKVRRSIR